MTIDSSLPYVMGRIEAAASTVVVWVAVSLPSCYDPDLVVGLTCTEDGKCPSGQACDVDNVCRQVLIGEQAGEGPDGGEESAGNEPNPDPDPEPDPIPDPNPSNTEPELVPILNGSFELWPEACTAPTMDVIKPGSTELVGWTIPPQNEVRLVSCYWQNADGDRSVDLRDGGEIRQTFETIAGRTYRVVFQLSGNPSGFSAGTKDVEVAVAGVIEQHSFPKTSQTPESMVWLPQTLEFDASSTAATLSFRSLEISSYGPLVDDVQVYLLPIENPGL